MFAFSSLLKPHATLNAACLDWDTMSKSTQGETKTLTELEEASLPCVTSDMAYFTTL